MSATVEKIQKVVNGVKVDVYPITKTSAVTDNDGTNLDSLLAGKQDALVSGTNIKTVNNKSLVGSGNITTPDHITTATTTGTGNAVTGVTADEDGNLTVTKGSTFLTDVPVATDTVLGGIKVGENLSITSDGVLSAGSSSDTKVTQTVTSTDGEYPILTKNTTDSTTSTDTARFAAAVTINPSTGTLTATNFSGNGSSLTNVNASTVNSFTVGKSVPADASFTDTVTKVSVSGTGNAITAISDNGSGQITATKGITFLTSADVSTFTTKTYVDNNDTSVYNAAKAYTDSIVSCPLNIKGTKTDVSQVKALTTAKTGDLWFVSSDNTEWVCTRDITAADPNAWEMLGTAGVNGTVYKGNNPFLDGYVVLADGTDGKVKSAAADASLVGLGNVTNNRQVKGLASGTTNGHVVVWGADGYTVADSGHTIASDVPADASFTDEHVALAAKNAAGKYGLVLTNTDVTGTITSPDSVAYNSNVYIENADDPSDLTLVAPNIGNSTTKFTGDGAGLTGVHADDADTVNSHTVNADVPSDAVFTDTLANVSTTGTGNVVVSVSDDNAGNINVTMGDVQETLVSGTNIITINGNSILTGDDLELAEAADVEDKANKVTDVSEGNFASLTTDGDLADSGYSLEVVTSDIDASVMTSVINTVEAGNGNAVTSGAVYTALQNIGPAEKTTWEQSNVPVDNTTYELGEIATLTITAAPSSNRNGVMIYFSSGSTPTVFNYPAGSKWMQAEIPEIEADKDYAVSILDGRFALYDITVQN